MRPKGHLSWDPYPEHGHTQVRCGLGHVEARALTEIGPSRASLGDVRACILCRFWAAPSKPAQLHTLPGTPTYPYIC